MKGRPYHYLIKTPTSCQSQRLTNQCVEPENGSLPGADLPCVRITPEIVCKTIAFLAKAYFKPKINRLI